ncbi:MAG TPA: type II secretion system F family protein [Candidatus Nitrosocosmicus sp.]|nr:type II secretion system F family protein [Candidatus Nitrosocosmicus sp.]
MLLILFVEIAALAMLYLYSRGKTEAVNGLESKVNRIAILRQVSFYIACRLASGKFPAYERKLASKLAVLYGSKEVKPRVRNHMAVKINFLISACLGVTLMGSLMEKPDTSYAVFAAVLLLAVFYAPDRELNERIKRKNFLVQYDFPDFLNKLVLLVNAGMTVPKAWEKIVTDRKNLTPLYEELNITYIEIRNGKSELDAYEDFARRCRAREITKFVTTIIQNQRKGNSELVPLLKLQSNECWQLRKNMARKLGEEASTKLVLPLMIMFVGILVIVILPAVLQLKYL